MNSKKKLSFWQFDIMMSLLLLIFVTMFLPAFHFNGQVVKKINNSVGINIDESEVKVVDDAVRELESRGVVNISYVAPINIMVNNFTSFFTGRHSVKELIEYNKNPLSSQEPPRYQVILENIVINLNGALDAKWNTLRVFLYVFYSLDLIFIILLIIAYKVEWHKLVPVITNLVWGILATIFLGIMRFGLINIFVGNVNRILGNYITQIGNGLLSYLYSFSFLVGFILAIVLLIFSFVCIFVGGEYVGSTYTPIKTPQNNSQNNSGGGITDNIAVDTDSAAHNYLCYDFVDSRNPGVIVGGGIVDTNTGKIVASNFINVGERQISNDAGGVITRRLGKVMCTKGIAIGQGFQLPEDKKVIIGRSHQKANLVINNSNVSNVHCSIRYNATHNTYIIKDHSTNGTFVNGVKLPKDIPVEYPTGTILSLADGTNQITLG